MPFKTIRFEVARGIATVTLNRPEKLNAANAEMFNELIEAFDGVDADDQIRAVIVTGSGRAFWAGIEVQSLRSAATADSPRSPDRRPDELHEVTRDPGGLVTLRIFNCRKPVIAAINGPAVGFGATMPLAMDMRLASRNAKFGFVFARRGIVLEAASSYFPPRLVGIATALEWCFSGSIFDAKIAQSEGLVKAVYEPDDLLPPAMGYAREIADNTPPVSIAMTREMLWRGLGHPMEAHRIENRGLGSRLQSCDAQEAIASFLEKWTAVFHDRVSADMPNYYPWWEGPEYR
ncbi:Enoyl-CoA hydratase [Burkholderia sp. GAS332]|nr:Enoyl-CoA hydratase [Burkholderia sp. GAS332]